MLQSILSGLFGLALFEVVLCMLIVGPHPLTFASMLVPPVIILLIKWLDCLEVPK